MIKKILISILILIFVLYISGCVNTENTEKNLFIGKWENIGSNAVITFESDGRYLMDYNLFDNEVVELKYELIENNVLRVFNNTFSTYFNYEFLDDNRLQLNARGSSDITILERIE